MKCLMIPLRHIALCMCAILTLAGTACRTQSAGNDAFINVARNILRGGDVDVEHVQLIQPSYDLSHASKHPVTAEVWALAIVALQGDAHDMSLVEPYLRHRDPQTRQAATNCLHLIQTPDLPTVEK